MLSNLRVAFAPMMWGTTYAVTTKLLPEGRPLLAATLRALVAGLVLLAVVRRLPRGQWWWRIAVLGALNIGGFFALLFIAAARLPGGLAAVLASCQPVLVLALSPALLGQAVRRTQVLYALTGIAGIALLVLRAASHPDLLGMLAALGAAGTSALGLVLTRRWRPPVGLWTMTAWQLTAGGVVLIPLLLATEGPARHLHLARPRRLRLAHRTQHHQRLLPLVRRTHPTTRCRSICARNAQPHHPPARWDGSGCTRP